MAGAPVLGANGKKTRELELAGEIFGVEIRPHLVHEAVRGEMAAARAATRGGKSRGMVAGGASKPWRQKGTGRARQGTIRAPQWTGGGMAFPPNARSFTLKVNRKAKKAAFRGALSAHATRGSVAVVEPSVLGDVPSTKAAAGLLAGWGTELPLVVVVQPGEDVVAKSFRNLPRAVVVEASELETGTVVWARSLLLSEAALARIQEVAR